MTLSPDDLVGQFILCKSADLVPPGWARRSHGPWFLGTHPSLPVFDVSAADSSMIGWLLGWAISPQAQLVNGGVQFALSPCGADAPGRFESSLYAYGGRFAAAMLTDRVSRFYLDPCGSLAAVFCPEQCIVASTPSLVSCVRDPEEENRRELVQAMNLAKLDSGCAFGLTPRRSVERLLPNHFLNLDTWGAERHWPIGEIRTNLDVRDSVL